MCPSAASSRKYRNAIRTVNFDGARMDKLTYAGLKRHGGRSIKGYCHMRRDKQWKRETWPSKSTGCRSPTRSCTSCKGVDFEVEQGSIFALLGSNGAGKTTIVKILTTLLKPDGGTASVDGFDVASQPAQRARVDQPDRAVRRRRRDPHRPGKPDHDRQAAARKESAPVADDLLEPFGLADAAERRVSTYSGGMRRRLDIAMSLIGEPPVIFLDEPTTGLDPEGAHRGVED